MQVGELEILLRTIGAAPGGSRQAMLILIMRSLTSCGHPRQQGRALCHNDWTDDLFGSGPGTWCPSKLRNTAHSPYNLFRALCREVVSRHEDKTANEGGILDRQRECDESSPRVTEHGGLIDTELDKRVPEQPCVCSGRPQDAWSRAVAVSGSVDDDDAVAFGEPAHQIADHKVLDHRAVAVDEDNRLTVATLKVVKSYPVDSQEFANRGMLALGPLSPAPVVKGCTAEEGCGRARQERYEPAGGRRSP